MNIPFPALDRGRGVIDSRGHRPMNDVPSAAPFMAGMAAVATAVMPLPGLVEAFAP